MSETAPTSTGRAALHEALVRRRAPLLLSLMDREAQSPTYGCFDRTYWQWKFTDFAGARFQEALLALAFLHARPGSEYSGNPRLLEWIRAGFEAWTRLQHRDGSFDEAYPLERSFVATGFTLFYLTEAFRLVGPSLPATTRERVLSAFARAARWLARNDEVHAFISNHRLGTCAGLFNAAALTGEAEAERRCWSLWRTVAAAQSPDGWFSEYGGADPGYLTQGIYYGAVLFERSGRDEVLAALRRAVDFMAYFVHPDGSAGGEYGSRNTEFVFPGGFELLARHHPMAEAICRRVAPALADAAIPSGDTVDAYNVMPLVNSSVTAALAASSTNPSATLPCDGPDFARTFDGFPIHVRKRADRLVIVGLAKGGVVKVFDLEARRLVLSRVGLFGRVGGQVVTSQSRDARDLRISVEAGGDRFRIEGPLVVANYEHLSPLKLVAFRLLGLASGVTALGSRLLKGAIVRSLIDRRRPTGGTFSRTIDLSDPRRVEVVTTTRGVEPGALREEERHTSYHMGSSKYYQRSDLELEPG